MYFCPSLRLNNIKYLNKHVFELTFTKNGNLRNLCVSIILQNKIIIEKHPER